MSGSKSYTIILLAAGSSSRFGSPKQLAKIDKKNFIQHAISESIKVAPHVIVVLGSNYDVVKKEIENFPVRIECNKDWQGGMSSSIRCGLSALIDYNPDTEAVVIIVCDQPFLSSEIISELISNYESTKKPIVACTYNDVVGTPVLFHRTLFYELRNLKGQAGAKKIISEHHDLTETISFPLGYIDIDTKEDYENLEQLSKS